MAYEGGPQAYNTLPELVPGPGERLIQLTRGFTALIDEADWSIVEPFSWRAHKARSKWYARADGPRKEAIYLHRLITGAQQGWVVDHLNHAGLDCRRDNIRVCGFDKNAQNADYRTSSTGFRGVTFENGRYRARLKVGGITQHLGVFNTPGEAGQAYDDEAVRVFGPYAWTNFPRQMSVLKEECAAPF